LHGVISDEYNYMLFGTHKTGTGYLRSVATFSLLFTVLGTLDAYRLRNPRSATFATAALGHIKRCIGGLMRVDVTAETVQQYQTRVRRIGGAEVDKPGDRVPLL
jgi:hypothetical protein